MNDLMARQEEVSSIVAQLNEYLSNNCVSCELNRSSFYEHSVFNVIRFRLLSDEGKVRQLIGSATLVYKEIGVFKRAVLTLRKLSPLSSEIGYREVTFPNARTVVQQIADLVADRAIELKLQQGRAARKGALKECPPLLALV